MKTIHPMLTVSIKEGRKGEKYFSNIKVIFKTYQAV